MSDITRPQKDYTAEAVLFSHLFKTLISAGVPLVKVLLILEAEAPAPYALAMPTVRQRIEEEKSLAEAITDLPELFPPFYFEIIRTGEIGGILDIALAMAADLLEEDWTLSKLIGTKPMLMSKDEESTLAPCRQLLQMLLFCRTWGSMLSSGVPIVLAMEVAADSLPKREHDQVMAARDIMMSRGTSEEIVEQISFLPQSAKYLIVLGMECGELDTMLLKIAELFHHQLVFQRQED